VLVVVQVDASADPGIDRARTDHPADGQHQVVHPGSALEIQEVDQIVFEFMDEGREDGHQRDAQPRRQGSARVQPGTPGHAREGEQHDPEADGVLVPQPGMTLPQGLASRAHHLANPGGFLGVRHCRRGLLSCLVHHPPGASLAIGKTGSQR